jgi:hypothetical protein
MRNKNKNSEILREPYTSKEKMRAIAIVGGSAIALVGSAALGIGIAQSIDPKNHETVSTSVEAISSNPESFVGKYVTVSGDASRLEVGYRTRVETVYNALTKKTETKIVQDAVSSYSLKSGSDGLSIVFKDVHNGSGYGVTVGFASDYAGSVTVEGKVEKADPEGDQKEVAYFINADEVSQTQG